MSRWLSFEYCRRRFQVEIVPEGAYWRAYAAEQRDGRYVDNGKQTSLYSQPHRAASAMVAALVAMVDLDNEAAARQAIREANRTRSGAANV